ncbi:MAG: HNH endonuclease [Alphaproteobacteria bacterium]|nr:HNH endonuclease [Alphaproteobacteria bacterium]
MSRRRRKNALRATGWRPHIALRIVATDGTFEPAVGRDGAGWLGKCIHCNSKLWVPASGSRQKGVTIEHIVPRAHGGDNTLENLALACSRCNGAKGRRLDHRAWSDPDLQAMILRLQERRRARWRTEDSAPPPGDAR